MTRPTDMTCHTCRFKELVPMVRKFREHSVLMCNRFGMAGLQAAEMRSATGPCGLEGKNWEKRDD